MDDDGGPRRLRGDRHDPEHPPASDQDAHGRLAAAVAARRRKLERLRARGIEPFALRFDSTASLGELHERFGHLPPDAETGDRVRVAGRIMLLRRHGQLSFATIRDRSADLQLFCTRADMGDGYELLDDLDLWDIVGAEGDVITTRRGELSIRVERLTLLTKSLHPPPEKWSGVRDPEARYRQRYVELAQSPESREIVRARAALLRSFRQTLEEAGFLEVETPVLHQTAGGALARPFVTHHRVLDVDLYLRIALELYLKRLLIGGLERVYEIGRNFRNEGIDYEHNPEFTMLEVYRAFGDYQDMMELAEALVTGAAMDLKGMLRFPYQGRELDLEPPWPRVTVLESVSRAVGEEVTLDRTDLAGVAERAGVGIDPAWSAGKIVLELFEKLCEKEIFQPTFVKDFPREVSPLARRHRTSPGLTEHFDLIIAGMEIGPAYSELTDPDEQRARFEEQQAARRRGDQEAHPLDEDFLRALEYGMPPAGGIGIGVDRVLMLLTDVPSIRETITFPHLRPEQGRR
jgi:lysyl-tRNA synthetase class 2